MQDLITIGGVRGRLDAHGNPELNLEDVARGLGFTTVATSGNEVVRWKRVESYIADFTECGQVNANKASSYVEEQNPLPEYIPEPIFYLLAMKARNDTAKAFQNRVAYEILPAIRKHGAYLTPTKIEEVLSDPDTIIQLATQLKQERSKRMELEEELDYSKEWLSIKRVAALNGVNWKSFDWRKLKQASLTMGLGPKKIFDANYGEVNTYHQRVWEKVYPQYEC